MAVGSTYAAVDVDSVGGLGVWLPTLALQRAIAQYLDAETARIDALIEKKRRMVELLEERLSSQVFAWITGHDRARADTRESNLGWVDRIADHWGTPPVSANFDLILGKMLNAAAVERGDQFPYLRNVNVQWDRIDFTDVASMHFNAEERRRFSLKRGDLLVCEGGEVGRAAVWQQGLENCYFQKAIHRLRPRNGTNARYLMYCLRAAADRGAFKVEGNTSTIVHLTGEQLRVHRFPWPPKDEQHEIVTKLDKASADHRRTVDVVTRQIDLLAERRSALITAAVTGELPIPGIAA